MSPIELLLPRIELPRLGEWAEWVLAQWTNLEGVGVEILLSLVPSHVHI